MKALLVGAVALGLLIAAAAVFAGGEPASVQADSLNGDWRVEWRGTQRFMHRDGTWHVWSSRSEWVPLRPGWTPDGPGE